MGRNRCCCAPGCQLGTDDFNDRSDGAVPSDDPQWKILSGTWEFDTGVVKSTSAGVLATRICHPSAYPLGSFWATFTLENPSVEKVYKIRAGNPVLSPYEVHIEILSGEPGDGELRITVVGDVTISGEFPWDETIEMTVCYAPGVELHANNGYTPGVTTCVGCDDCYRCYTDVGASGSSVGNFAFLQGDFDNWVYEVHWIENHDCNHCDCFCYDEDADESTCIPDELTLILTDLTPFHCQGLDGMTITLERVLTGSTWKRLWRSATKQCASECLGGNLEFVVELTCEGGGEISPFQSNWQLAFRDTAGNYSGAIGWINEATNTGFPIKARSSCDPLEFVFEGLTVETCTTDFRDGEMYGIGHCCGDEWPSDEIDIRLEATLTA